MTLVIKACSAADIIHDPCFPALRREYAAESAIAGLPDPAEKLALYEAMEGSGALTLYGAFVRKASVGEYVENAEAAGAAEEAEAELVGFVAVLCPVLPHYGLVVAVTESLFVAREHRRTGAGLALIRRAERHAKAINSPGLLMSAPAGGRLHRLLPRMGYRVTNVAFFKGFPKCSEGGFAHA